MIALVGGVTLSISLAGPLAEYGPAGLRTAPGPELAGVGPDLPAVPGPAGPGAPFARKLATTTIATTAAAAAAGIMNLAGQVRRGAGRGRRTARLLSWSQA